MPEDDKKFFICDDTDIEGLIEYWANVLEVDEKVAREGVLEWQRRGGVTMDEQATIFNTAYANYTMKKMVGEGLMDMTVNEDGDFMFSLTDLGRKTTEDILRDSL